MESTKIHEIVNDSVNETMELINGYVVEYFDSSSDEMRKAVEDLKTELILRFNEIASKL